MEAQSLNIWETYPAVLDISSLRADPYLTRARIGADACTDVLARDFGQISTTPVPPTAHGRTPAMPEPTDTALLTSETATNDRQEVQER